MDALFLEECKTKGIYFNMQNLEIYEILKIGDFRRGQKPNLSVTAGTHADTIFK